jgi:hypothetical protein
VSDEIQPPRAPDWDAPEAPEITRPYGDADALDVAEPMPQDATDRSRPPTSRSPGGRPSPDHLPDAEIWRGTPDPPPPGRTLRQRLWWVLPFGGSLLAGIVYVAILALADGGPARLDITGKVCFVTTLVALVAAALVGSPMPWPSSPRSLFWGPEHGASAVLAVCILLFAAAPTLTWIVLAAR